ncbi:protein of unknown function [Shewanella benthica]|uniref:Uncharacterized protein n=1 Tax=Shewanella benthica TaxID=43661 RepID=A0A330M6W2_9GAMM|nr:protein of unknown function [Shewanella benthica]
MSICGDYRDIGGTSPWMDKGRIMQELLSRVKQGDNHAMMAFEREKWRSNWLFNKDVIARTESNYRPGIVAFAVIPDLFRDPALVCSF